MTGGEDWGDMAASAREVHPLYYMFFLILIGFLVLAVLNILTGIFVNNALEISENDRDNILFEASNERQDFAENIKRIFHDMDDDGDGTISWEEFKTHIVKFHVRASLASLGVDVRDAEGFFKLLANMAANNLHRKGVDIDSFANGCLRLKGVARMIDVQGLAFQMKSLQKMEERLTTFCWEQFEHIRHILGDDSEVVLPPLYQKSSTGEVTAPSSQGGSKVVSTVTSRRPSLGRANTMDAGHKAHTPNFGLSEATHEVAASSPDLNPEPCAGVPAVTSGHAGGTAVTYLVLQQPQTLSRSNSGNRRAPKAAMAPEANASLPKEGLPSIPNATRSSLPASTVSSQSDNLNDNVNGNNVLVPPRILGTAALTTESIEVVMPGGPRPGTPVRPRELAV